MNSKSNKMKKRILMVALFCIAVLSAFIAGYLKGRQNAFLEDFKTYSADLVIYSDLSTNAKVGIKEFLKARYYYTANKLPDGWLGVPYDYGSVDFSNLTIGKGPTTPRQEYQTFKEKKVSFRDAKN